MHYCAIIIGSSHYCRIMTRLGCSCNKTTGTAGLRVANPRMRGAQREVGDRQN